MRFVAFATILLAAWCFACSKEPPASEVAKAPVYPFDEDPAIAEIAAFIASHDVTLGGERIDKSRSAWRFFVPKPPKVAFTPSKTYVWRLTTSHGPLNVRLFTADAPHHCSAILYLAMLGYFDGLGFPRVIQQFLAQGGDPRGDGTGDPGYALDLEISPNLKHDRPFIVSTANSGEGTDNSQFFVTFRAVPSLDGRYSIFGELHDEESKKTARVMDALGSLVEGPPSEKITILSSTYTVE